MLVDLIQQGDLLLIFSYKEELNLKPSIPHIALMQHLKKLYIHINSDLKIRCWVKHTWGICWFGFLHHKSVNFYSLFSSSHSHPQPLKGHILCAVCDWNSEKHIHPTIYQTPIMDVLWRIIHLVFLTTVLGSRAPMAEGCSCERLHPQQHYCSASYGE